MKRPQILVLLFIAALFAFGLAVPAFSQPQTDAVAAGSKVTLAASAEGSLPMSFEWFKGTAKIGDGPQFVIAALAVTDAGVYTVKATNDAGNATSPILTITVSVAPTNPTIKITAVKPSGVTVSVPAGTRVITIPNR